jgi:acetate kinase
VLLYLQRANHMDADSLEKLLNHNAGLAALSGGIEDMRKLQMDADHGNADAALAIDVFCLAIRKTVAAYAAVLGGIDVLIFAGGIGEHSSQVRKHVCDGLGFLGITIDDDQNCGNRAMISGAGSKVQVRIVPSQEDRQIARHCRALMRRS